jgi:hypothetical protein
MHGWDSIKRLFSRLANGQPIQIDNERSDKQGYNPAKYNRNHLVTALYPEVPGS